MTIRLAPINHRHQLADICRYRRAVEVGTHRGIFAEELCRVRGDGGKLFCVDPYLSYAGDRFLADKGTTRLDDLVEARRLLRPHLREDRCELLKCTSLEAALLFEPASLCLVYVDASHDRYDVRDDLEAWWPLVRPGGLLAGHDFVCPGEPHNDGVQAAVLEFSYGRGLDVHIVPENAPETAGQPWSFYMEKPK